MFPLLMPQNCILFHLPYRSFDVAPQLPVQPSDLADAAQWELAMRSRCLKVLVCHSGLALLVKNFTASLYPHEVLPHESSSVSLPKFQAGGGEQREVDDPLNDSFFSGTEII